MHVGLTSHQKSILKGRNGLLAIWNQFVCSLYVCTTTLVNLKHVHISIIIEGEATNTKVAETVLGYD